jgi:hypothetical protein
LRRNVFQPLSVLAYNLTRVINIVGVKPLIAAIAA